MPPKVSAIVPILADRQPLLQLLAQIAPDPRLEIVIVDGGRGHGAADAEMNSRRLRSTLFGVISEERMSGALLISMGGL